MSNTLNMLTNTELSEIVKTSLYYTYFKDRLYVYNKETKQIVGYMLKNDFDPEKTFQETDLTAGEKFAVISMTFKNKKEEKLFDEEAFEDVVIEELEVWLSYDSNFEEE